MLGEETVVARRGDFVNIPTGLVHRFRNAGTETARLVLTFVPAGIEGFFRETLDSAPSDSRRFPTTSTRSPHATRLRRSDTE